MSNLRDHLKHKRFSVRTETVEHEGATFTVRSSADAGLFAYVYAHDGPARREEAGHLSRVVSSRVNETWKCPEEIVPTIRLIQRTLVDEDGKGYPIDVIAELAAKDGPLFWALAEAAAKCIGANGDAVDVQAEIASGNSPEPTSQDS